jgi:quercetin dioxygenase-like cupin family protein
MKSGMEVGTSATIGHHKILAILLLATAALVAIALAQDVIRPTAKYNVSFESMTMTGPFTVTQQVLELAPGAASPVHKHGGPELILALDGELTFLLDDSGEEVTVSAGETRMIPADTFLQVRNDSNSNASFVVTFLLPQGATLTTPR